MCTMRVTLLAAGFVIGARGASARQIGQQTGAVLQSWTDEDKGDVGPCRVFRIQGKRSQVGFLSNLPQLGTQSLVVSIERSLCFVGFWKYLFVTFGEVESVYCGQEVA